MLTIVLASVFLLCCSNHLAPEDTDKPPYPHGRQLSSAERKEITNNFLKKIRVPILNSLPVVEDHTNAHFRTNIEVARRCLILFSLISVAKNQMTGIEAIGYLKKYKLWVNVAPSEAEYLKNANRPKQADIDISWQIERLNVLLWALNIIDTLPLPLKECDFTNYKNLPDAKNNPLNWIENTRLRSKEDILNETDLIYRIHWATTEARLHNQPMPYNFNNDVVFERHFALNWLVVYSENWDDITTDT
ncbi:MAG TPA: DUF4272 domain-containing protein [Mucilaginibacter sp.]|nr:DUF4272 domain-containing protein [Mucilaginibacter sp.]